jgi:AcrR family transcriptional regulator
MASLLAPIVVAADDRGYCILASIRQTFAEKGFDGASMQDLARAAGMSVGNFYRYFPSKAAIVEAMCALDLAEIERDFVEVIVSTDPMSALRTKIVERIGENCPHDGQLWAEITAASVRKPEIAVAASQMETAIVRHLASIFARVTGREPQDALERYQGQCQLLVMLVKGVAMRASQYGPAKDDLAQVILRTIDRTLAEISADMTRG